MENLQDLVRPLLGTSVTSWSSLGASKSRSDIQCGGLIQKPGVGGDQCVLAAFPNQCWTPQIAGLCPPPKGWLWGCWGNTAVFVQVLLGSRGSLNQHFVMLKILSFNNIVIAAGLLGWRSEMVFSGKHWLAFLCLFVNETPNKTNKQKTPNKKKPKSQTNKQKKTPQKPNEKHSNKNLLVFSLKKVWLLFFLFLDDNCVVKTKDLCKWVGKSNFAEDFESFWGMEKGRKATL